MIFFKNIKRGFIMIPDQLGNISFTNGVFTLRCIFPSGRFGKKGCLSVLVTGKDVDEPIHFRHKSASLEELFNPDCTINYEHLVALVGEIFPDYL